MLLCWRVWVCAVVAAAVGVANASNAVENKHKPRTSSLFALPKQALETAKASEVDDNDVNANAEGGNREKKLLSFFNVVRFPNQSCNTTSGDSGVCYTAAECSSKGGSSSGSCAAGFGVCCLFVLGCGGTSNNNCTYFSSSDTDTSPCTVRICRASSNVCQLRLDFDSFEIAQPEVATSVLPAAVTPKTECVQAAFTVGSDGTQPSIICGQNNNQHMYTEASSDCNTLSFSWLTKAAKGNWKIKVCQIACDDQNKAPEGCTQYFTGTSQTVQSFNFQGSTHLANQKQIVCIRQEAGSCTITWTATINDFAVSTDTNPGNTGTYCTLDFVVIPNSGQVDKFCGSQFNGGTLTQASTTLPFRLEFFSDAGESLPNDGPTGDFGFSLAYKQSAGGC